MPAVTESQPSLCHFPLGIMKPTEKKKTSIYLSILEIGWDFSLTLWDLKIQDRKQVA